MDLTKFFSLEGRVALVTGGSRGVGRMIAEGFIAQGARVYITARKADACDATAHELGGNCISIPGDISTVEGCKALAEELGKREDHLDILVNNAGAAWGEPFAQFPEAGWDKVMDLNVKSPFFLTQALHGMLKASGESGQMAKVINIGSIDGIRLNQWETYSYQASKAAILQLTKRMAGHLISDNIGVTAIAPGAFASDMNRAARDYGDAVAKAIPAGRIGIPEDMAAAAVYLAARSGDYVIGSTLIVDGGLVNGDVGGGATKFI
ncbi:SDR family oxidoreductase [Shimia biformata]|uniref:SDR family oxidoreductase n=1 Tax=Shimia biformata TaxID=1294299 RepID=UPI001950D660|nr:SDR family oxidoreductase [Shimia biformata]